MGPKTTGARGALSSGTAIVMAIFAVFLAALAVVFFGLPSSGGGNAPPAVAIEKDGALTASARAEPRTFNKLVGPDFSTEVFGYLTQARLARVNRVTGELEPELAESWEEARLRPGTTSDGATAPAGPTYTVKLRQGIRFSDGAPFTSADVLFSFEAAYDEKTGSPLAELLVVDGKPLQVTAPDASTVTIAFPAPFGPGMRLLDNLPIMAKHRLEPALREGKLRQAWTTATPPSMLAGLGPFALERYEPGQRLTFVRNPNYWRRAADGSPLPALARLTLEIVPDQNAEIVRLESGQIDFTGSEVRADDYVILKRAADAGRLQLTDLGAGVDADGLWFNLAPEKNEKNDKNDKKPAWLKDEAFRHAISHAIDRKAFADAVFLGAAVPIWGPVTPGNKDWHVDNLPRREFDLAKAQALLKGLGPSTFQFTLLTLKGNAAAERGASFIRAELADIGVTVDVVPLEVGSLVERLTKGDYDAIYYRLLASDTDPAMNLDFWLSSGGAHVWNPEQQTPATEWERQMDDLMRRQARSTDREERRRLFAEAQRVFTEHEPILYFAAPKVIVATSRRVANAQPAVTRPNILWNPAVLAAARLEAKRPE